MQALINPAEMPFNLIQEVTNDGARIQKERDTKRERIKAFERNQIDMFNPAGKE